MHDSYTHRYLYHSHKNPYSFNNTLCNDVSNTSKGETYIMWELFSIVYDVSITYIRKHSGPVGLTGGIHPLMKPIALFTVESTKSHVTL